MTAVVPVQGAILDSVLDAIYPISPDGLDRHALGRFDAAQMKTAWGRRCQQRFALVEGVDVLASAACYDLAGRFEGRAVRICGIGSVFTDPSRRGLGHARVLLETLIDEAAGKGAEVALLFSKTGVEHDAPGGFEAIPSTEVTLDVASSRHGAPMTMVRGGEERDLAAIAAMGRVRAGPFRFHLDRDSDLIQYAITRKRLLAGLGSTDARQLLFVIAEEGITAAAYVVVSVAGSTWTLEECGDRDASGARVGALLQALIAREPSERRPTIRAWLPPRFLPPQIRIVSATPSTEIMMVRLLGAGPILPKLSGDEVLYWRSDFF